MKRLPGSQTDKLQGLQGYDGLPGLEDPHTLNQRYQDATDVSRTAHHIGQVAGLLHQSALMNSRISPTWTDLGYTDPDESTWSSQLIPTSAHLVELESAEPQPSVPETEPASWRSSSSAVPIAEILAGIREQRARVTGLSESVRLRARQDRESRQSGQGRRWFDVPE